MLSRGIPITVVMLILSIKLRFGINLGGPEFQEILSGFLTANPVLLTHWDLLVAANTNTLTSDFVDDVYGLANLIEHQTGDALREAFNNHLAASAAKIALMILMILYTGILSDEAADLLIRFQGPCSGSS